MNALFYFYDNSATVNIFKEIVLKWYLPQKIIADLDISDNEKQEPRCKCAGKTGWVSEPYLGFCQIRCTFFRKYLALKTY